MNSPSLEVAWKIPRPKLALPDSYLWTWDHSANWMLDDPGVLNFGCNNRYLKRPETFIEDYRRLTDFAAGLGIPSVVIWGFLRDSHGGVESAKRVAGYGASRGVAVYPGVGTTGYCGIYYEGDHPFNSPTFLRQHPDAALIQQDGRPSDHALCASHPASLEWIQTGLRWLFREFEIGGVNLENGDFNICHDPRCKEKMAAWPQEEADFSKYQALSYIPAIEALTDQLPSKLIAYATYTSFHLQRDMGCACPAMFRKLPAASVAQWNVHSMLLQEPLPLTVYLDDGAPSVAFSNPNWPRDLTAPVARNVAFVHQASQWHDRVPRYEQMVSTIKEACLRAWRGGLSGVAIHGEVTPRHIPYALNYLAFSHFIHWPEDTLRDFGRKTLAHVLGSESEGEAFVEMLAHWDAGTLTEAQRRDISSRTDTLRLKVQKGETLAPWRFWDWLARMSRGEKERHTVSFF